MNESATPSIKTLNVYQRVQKVMDKVSYLQKDKKVETYMAVTHDAVTALVRPHFLEFGIVISPTQISGTVKDTGTFTGKGTPIIRYEGVYDIHFVNVDEPADRITIHIESHANDYGDKAPGKALSYATKYAVLKLLMIETGENDEGRFEGAHEEPNPEKSAKLVADWKAAMDEHTTREALKECALKGISIAVQNVDKEAEKALRLYYTLKRDSLPITKAKAAA